MAAKGPLFDFLVIILLASGVTALGLHDLTASVHIEKVVRRSGEKSVIDEFQEDLSGRLTEGAPVEELMPKTEKEMKARYPWEIKFTADTATEKEGHVPILTRLKNLLFPTISKKKD